ncbi:class I SAM-dependent methyltransferase [Candidatus Woesearchaeota archaeon]|nr:class I SAM-dependent methyltransferase [Candidatus Woesearchaeota archaeon]
MIFEFFIISKKIKGHITNIFINKHDKILDLGCGNNPNYHKNIKGKIICFDKVKTKITHAVGDADKLPFKNNSFDKIISINSFYYFKNPFASINEIKRVLKHNGKFVLVLPFIYPIHDAPYDKYRFTEYGLREILSGFIIKDIKAIGGIFNLPTVLIHSLIKGLPLIAPKYLKGIAKFFSVVLFYPFYVAAQIFSLLDFLDITKRWPTYYFVVAVNAFPPIKDWRKF